MLRVLAILVLVACGLPGLGAASAGGWGLGGASACHEPVVEMSCCSSSTADNRFCPMSNGPCECIEAPAPSPERRPDAPLPRSDRDSITGLPNGPPQVAPVVEPADTVACMASLVVGSPSKTHNEIQALLGVWRT